jgi:hypothetical protein
MHNESVTIICAQTLFSSIMSAFFFCFQVSPSCPVRTVNLVWAVQRLSKGQLT